jgi:hypothetical protein
MISGAGLANKNTSGYLKLPGGIIIQWGQFSTMVLTGNTSYAVTFPLAFPNACLNVMTSHYAQAVLGPNTYTFGSDLGSLTGFSVYGGTNTSGMGFKWVAIGY